MFAWYKQDIAPIFSNFVQTLLDMRNLIVENNDKQMILKINKEGFDTNYLISLLKRLQIEDLAKKSGFDPKVLAIAEEIKEGWWDKNGEEFLKDISR
jgi:hypothetical protein